MMKSQPVFLSARELYVGMRAECLREVSQSDIRSFGELTGDLNPLHLDPIYAASTNYAGTIAHGAYQLALCSALAGMQLPGKNCLITSVEARFPSPLKLPASVSVQGEIAAWNPSITAGRLRVTVIDRIHGRVCCEAGIGFSLHEERSPNQTIHSTFPQPAEINDHAKPLVLVTGATGGLGQAIVEGLVTEYNVLAIVNKNPLPPHLVQAGVGHVSADLASPQLAQQILKQLAGHTLFAVIHLAWPGLARGGLLNQPAGSLEAQVLAGTCQLVELAKILRETGSKDGARLISIGSIAGSQKPLTSLAAYSLGKAALEHTTRLLAAELGVLRIAVNAICPSLVPVGMNQQMDSRRQKLESASVPLGRLCTPADVLQAVHWLLSPKASFVSGQIIGLNGGQL